MKTGLWADRRSAWALPAMATAVAAVLALAACSSARLVGNRPELSAPESRWVLIDGRYTHYFDTGGNGRAIIIVHGFASCCFPFEAIIDHLRSSFRVVAPDLPGHGYSEGLEDEYTVGRLVTFLHRFVEEIELHPVVWCGSSMGANIVLHYADSYPSEVEKLVLLCPVGLAGQEGRLAAISHRRVLLRLVSGVVGRNTVRRALIWVAGGNASHVSEDLVDTYYLSISTRKHRLCLVSVVDNIIAGSRLDDTLPLIKQPVLIIAGGNDPLLDDGHIETYRRLLPDVETVVFRGGTHLLHQEKPAEIAAFIGYFLRP